MTGILKPTEHIKYKKVPSLMKLSFGLVDRYSPSFLSIPKALAWAKLESPVGAYQNKDY